MDEISKQNITNLNNNTPKSTLTTFEPKELRRLNKVKLTQTKQDKFLDLYSNYPNMAKCAKKTGVSTTAIQNTMNRDPAFKSQIMNIRANINEDMKEAMVLQGCVPDARGSKDRQLWLQAYDEDFKKQPETQANIQINIESNGEVKSILSKIMPD